jgi:hypothetical protein
LLFLYYPIAIFWVRRKDSPASTVIQYSPPADMSPAEMRYVLTGEFDEKGVAAAVVHLAAQGLVRFAGLDDYYAVSRTGVGLPPDLPPDELAVYRAMFNLDQAGSAPFPGRLRTYAELPHDAFLLPPPDQENFVLLAAATKDALKSFTEPKHFTPNIPFIAPAGILSLFLIFVRVQHPGVALFAALIITAGALALKLPDELLAVSGKTNSGNLAGIRVLFVMLCLGVFGALNEGSLLFLISLAVVISVNLFFAPQLRGRTRLCRERTTQIEGYRAFLKEVELDRMERLKSADWKPNENTGYLAYALALDLGHAWDDYLAHSGYWTAAADRKKSPLPPQMVRVRAPLVTLDAWLGFGLIMLLLSGSIVLFLRMTGAPDSSPPGVSGESLAAYFVMAFLLIFVVLAIRSR